MIQPLAGVKVLDFTHGFAGPMSTYQLGLLGAEVTKIERPETGDSFRARGPIFDAVNGGKRSVVMDFKGPSAGEELRDLVAGADIIVLNFRPSVAAKMGLEPEDILRQNPAAVVCTISGYGRRGDWADVPAIEWTAQAASGLMSSYVETDDRSQHGVLLLDPFTGMLAAQSVLAAWLERLRTGEGLHVDVALLDTALIAQSGQVPDAATGSAAPPMVERVGVGRFPAADGAVYIGAVPREWQRKVFDVLGIDHAEFDRIDADPAPIDAMRATIEAAAATWSAAELAAAINDTGVPAAVVERLEDVLRPEHPLASHVSLEQVGGVDGATRSVVGSGVRYNGRSLAPKGDAPALGQHGILGG